MNPKKRGTRLAALGAVFLAMMVVYTVRLVQLQLLKGSDYLEQVDSTYSSTTKLNAARGEITDRYGRVLAGNKTVTNVILERAYIPEEKLNETVLSLCALLTECKAGWIDNLPLTVESNNTVTFKADSDNAIASLKKFLTLQTYATAQNCMDALIERYDLSDTDSSGVPAEKVYTLAEKRRIIGIRYEMEQTGFSLSVNYTFAENINEATLTRVKENAYAIPGLDVEQEPIRTYFSGTLVPHVIGSIGPIYAEEAKELLDKGYALNEKVGKAGIEAYCEDQLRGISGLRQVTRNKNGDVLGDTVIKEPVAGATVSLTIDSKLQDYVQKALARRVDYFKKNYSFASGMEGGAVVVLDTNTFEVLAMATYPSYDINDYFENYSGLLNQKYQPLFNRAVQGAYRPGSIFKPIVASLALNEGTITANSTVNCQHAYTYYSDLTVYCLGYHGAVNVNSAMQVSCNCFFYDVGRRLGIEKLSAGATNYFGIGQPTGIQIGENTGVMSSPDTKEELQGIEWYPGDTLQTAIGQMDTTISPLQMAVYAATIANNGVRKEVSIIHEINKADGSGTVWKNPQKTLSTFPNNNNALATVKKAMITAAKYYGCFDNYGFDICAKTGTPQNTGQTDSGTMITFAPAENPQIAIACVGEKMGKGYILGQLANDIYNYYFNQKNSATAVPGDNTLLN